MHHRIYVSLLCKCIQPRSIRRYNNAKFLCSLNCVAVRDENAIAWLELTRFPSSPSTTCTQHSTANEANHATTKTPKKLCLLIPNCVTDLYFYHIYLSPVSTPTHPTIHILVRDRCLEFRMLAQSLNLTILYLIESVLSAAHIVAYGFCNCTMCVCCVSCFVGRVVCHVSTVVEMNGKGWRTILP